jgi:hypothetical protein
MVIDKKVEIKREKEKEIGSDWEDWEEGCSEVD